MERGEILTLLLHGILLTLSDERSQRRVGWARDQGKKTRVAEQHCQVIYHLCQLVPLPVAARHPSSLPE